MSKIKYYSKENFAEVDESESSIYQYSYLMSKYVDEIRAYTRLNARDAKVELLNAMALFNVDITTAKEIIVSCSRVAF